MPALGAVAGAGAALAWLLLPPGGRMDGAEQLWAAEAPHVAPVATPPAPAAAAPAAVAWTPAEREWMPDLAAGPTAREQPPVDLLGEQPTAAPPSLPAEVIEAPPPLADLLLDEGADVEAGQGW